MSKYLIKVKILLNLYDAIKDNNIELVARLLPNRMSMDFLTVDFTKALDIAVKNSRTTIVTLLLNSYELKLKKMEAFSLAVKYGSTEIVALLLKDRRLKFTFCDNHLNTYLHLAAQNGSTEIVKLFLKDARFDPSNSNAKNQTAFDIAIEKGHAAIVKLFLEDGRVDPTNSNPKKKTPLHIAVAKGYIEIVKLLLKDHRVDLNSLDVDKRTAFSIVADTGDLEIVNLFLKDDRVKVNCLDNDLNTPLHRAVIFGRIEVVRVLLENPMVDPNSANNKDVVPFLYSFRDAVPEMINLFFTNPRIKICLPLVEECLNFLKNKQNKLYHADNISRDIFKKGLLDGNIDVINIGLRYFSDKESLLTTVLITAAPNLLSWQKYNYYTSAIGETAFTFAIKTNNIKMLNAFFSNISTEEAIKYLDIANNYGEKPLDISKQRYYRHLDEILMKKINEPQNLSLAV